MPIVPEDPDYENADLLQDRRHGPRRADDDGWPVNGSVVAWAKAISIVGGTTAIAILLAWRLTLALPVLEAKAIETEQLVIDIQKQNLLEQQEQAASYRLLQKICSNTAKNDDDRQRCFER